MIAPTLRRLDTNIDALSKWEENRRNAGFGTRPLRNAVKLLTGYREMLYPCSDAVWFDRFTRGES